MLEKVDFSLPALAKEVFKPRYDAALDELVVLQQKAHEKGIGLVVLLEGWNGAGKGGRISDLMYHLDARATTVHVTRDLDADELNTFSKNNDKVTGFYPLMQDFWKALGPRGAITFYDRGWYTSATQHMLCVEYGDVLPRVHRRKENQDVTAKKAAKRAAAEAARYERSVDILQQELESIADFERQLTDDGYLVVKFFVHVTQEAQQKRLERLYNDPATRWRVSKKKLESVKDYAGAYRMFDFLLEESDFSYAPWQLLNGEDKRAANLAIAETLTRVIRDALEAQPDADAAAAAQKAAANSAGALETAPRESRTPEQEQIIRQAAEREAAESAKHAPRVSRFVQAENPPRLDEASYTKVLAPELYKAQLRAQQDRLAKLEMEMYQRRIPLMIMYEGWDAAGKGGNIKRVAQALDARSYTVFPSPAPTKPELLHPHLWRYWTRLPKAGHVGIYDRSWYGRVLVERVEGFASDAVWGRAYDEINEFERDLIRWGAILLKFWVDVSPEEQLRRFRDREQDVSKQWKITEEDWRNRDKYPQYKAAVEDMFRLTSTTFAPWILLESDNKHYARVRALEIINDTLEARLRER